MNKYRYRFRVFRSEQSYITLGGSKRKPWIAVCESEYDHRKDWRTCVPEEGSTRGFLRRFKTEQDAVFWGEQRARELLESTDAVNREIVNRESGTLVYASNTDSAPAKGRNDAS